jgi:hypothetical protein
VKLVDGADPPAKAVVVRNLVRQLVGRALVLGSIGLIAVGASGLVAAIGGWTLGRSWVAGDPPSVHYSSARCSDFREYAPGARTCEQAATSHHFGEVVNYRLLAGIVGVALLIVCVACTKRGWHLFRTDRLPIAFDATIAATIFTILGIGLVGYGVDQQALGYAGAGAYLSAGLVAIIAAAISAWQFARHLTHVIQTSSAEG